MTNFMNTLNRRNAYQETYTSLTEVVFIDLKGVWTAGELIRTKREENENTYDFYIQFKADPDGAPKASTYFTKSLRIFMRSTDDANTLKRRIREAAGYTPAPATIRMLWAHFMLLHAAYIEEDRFYARADQVTAEAILNALYEKAIQRFKDGELCVSKERVQHYRTYERYLSQSEQEEATEAQKRINGHGFVLRMSQFEKNGHLARFNQRIADDIERLGKLKELEMKRDHDSFLEKMMESDVTFRQLVAHAIAASREIRCKRPEIELANRLFGYSKNLDEYREKYSKIDEMLRPYRLRDYDTSKLVSLGMAYLEAGGMLPVVAPVFERGPDKIYYGDMVHDGYTSYIVRMVGSRYIYVEGSSHRLLKQHVKLFTRVEPIVSPVRPDEYLFNECVRLHNNKWIPEAVSIPIAEVCSRLLNTRISRPQQLQQMYERKRDAATGHGEKAAFQRILYEFRILALKNQIGSLAGISNVGSYREVYRKAQEELNEIEELIKAG